MLNDEIKEMVEGVEKLYKHGYHNTREGRLISIKKFIYDRCPKIVKTLSKENECLREQLDEANKNFLRCQRILSLGYGKDRIELINKLAAAKEELELLRDLEVLALGFYKATKEWNASVEKIIGRQPQTGIQIDDLGKAIENLNKWRKENG